MLMGADFGVDDAHVASSRPARPVGPTGAAHPQTGPWRMGLRLSGGCNPCLGVEGLQRRLRDTPPLSGKLLERGCFEQ